MNAPPPRHRSEEGVIYIIDPRQDTLPETVGVAREVGGQAALIFVALEPDVSLMNTDPTSYFVSFTNSNRNWLKVLGNLPLPCRFSEPYSKQCKSFWWPTLWPQGCGGSELHPTLRLGFQKILHATT